MMLFDYCCFDASRRAYRLFCSRRVRSENTPKMPSLMQFIEPPLRHVCCRAARKDAW